ncbi:MAG: glucose-1-phosphate cytidylyltransferase [Candidatus Omnitrophica bacterium]|nr:glucose-1-phosphate cytidylyltransferase [Candidatus Omnitrophota bacterium]
MKVVIFCGGMGTRLREETEFRPKPMVEIGGRPILWHIMRNYLTHGINEFILCLGYKQEYIRQYFLNYEHMNNDFTIHFNSDTKVLFHERHTEDWRVTLVDTGLNTPKGRRLKMVEPYIKEDTFMVTYGDGVGNINIQALLDYHREQKKIATFTGVHPLSRFATIQMDDRGKIKLWKEKRQIEEYINAGYFVFNRDIFHYLDKYEELEMAPMEKLTEEGQVAMYRHEGFWQCMDTYRDHQLLEGLWNDGNAPWKIW